MIFDVSENEIMNKMKENAVALTDNNMSDNTKTIHIILPQAQNMCNQMVTSEIRE